MLVAVAMLVGAVLFWLLVDQWLLWRKEQQHRGTSSWREYGPGSVFHASGFEDTHPPHELVDLRFGQPANAIHHKRAA